MQAVIILFLTLLVLPTVAFADVKVEISNNLEGSDNNVKVNSNTSSNNGSSGSMDNQTSIRINNNGEVKEYKGNGSNVELKSSDGKSSVSVNTNGAGNNTTQSNAKINNKTNITVNSSTSDSEASPSSSPEATVAGVMIENTDEDKVVDRPGLLEYIKRQFKQLFNLFS